ncbi:MAG: ABC transporter substrate-binding protein, partial [Rubrimonas sp.]
MTSFMKRRAFLGGAAVAGAGAVGAATGAFPAPAIASGVIEMRMVTSWPRGLPGVGVGAERLASRIEAMSDGR